MKRTAASLTAVCLLLCSGAACADIVSPGIYRGYYFLDRWGQQVLNWGTSYTFVSDSVARRIQEYEEKPIELNVTSIVQENTTFEAGTIMKVDRLQVLTSPRMGLKVHLEAGGQRVAQGLGLKVELSLRNESKDDVTLRPGAICVVMVTNRPFSNAAIGYKDPDDRAYWYHQHLGPGDQRVACREQRAAWDAEYLAAHGKKVSTRSPDPRHGGEVVAFAPGGEFIQDLVVGKELLAGAYEVFVYIADEFPSPMSNRVAFDVLKGGAPAPLFVVPPNAKP